MDTERFLIRKAPESNEFLEAYCFTTKRYKWTNNRKQAWALTWRQAQSRHYLVQGFNASAVIVRQ